MKIFRVSFRELAERTGMGERGEDEGDLVRKGRGPRSGWCERTLSA